MGAWQCSCEGSAANASTTPGKGLAKQFSLNISRKGSVMRAVRHCPRLPRGAVEAFEVRLDGAVSYLSWWELSLRVAGTG